jgi:hypothetical protein
VILILLSCSDFSNENRVEVQFMFRTKRFSFEFEISRVMFQVQDFSKSKPIFWINHDSDLGLKYMIKKIQD